MSDIISRLTPTTYQPVRIALEERDGAIVAEADFIIRNANGEQIEWDHPEVTLTAGEQSTFLAWFLGKLSDYETATGLTRWTGGEV